MQVILVRHGERSRSHLVDEDRQGLTSAGRDAVRLVARRLSEGHSGSLAAIVASPFKPAVETAELIADELNGPKVSKWDEPRRGIPARRCVPGSKSCYSPHRREES